MRIDIRSQKTLRLRLSGTQVVLTSLLTSGALSQRNSVGSPIRCSLKKCISDKAIFLRKIAPNNAEGPLL
jgi:hypothetical protein